MKTLKLLLVLIISSITVSGQNNALNFDGTNDKVTATSPSLFENIASNDFTIELWARIDNLTGYPTWTRLFEVIDDGNEFIQLAIPLTGIAQIIVEDNGTQYKQNINDALTEGVWYHFAVSWDASSNDIDLYLNGIEQSTAGAGSAVEGNMTNTIYLGGRSSGSGDFNGALDEFRIWSDIRTQSEIRKYMYQEVSTSDSGLEIYYKMNETSGTLVDNAEETSTYDGTSSGTSTITSPAFFGPRYCLDFDGTNDYVNCGNSSDFNSTSVITIEAWVYLHSATTFDRMLIRSETGDNTLANCCYSLCFDNTTKPRFAISNAYITCPYAIDIGKWYHIAGTYDKNAGSNQMKLYVNGELVQTGDYSGDIPAVYTYDITLGASYNTSGSYYLNGRLDEVRLWQRCLGIDEIRKNMYKSLAGTESSLAFYWMLDQQ